MDASNEKLGYRIRKAQMDKIPYSIVLGDKERDEHLITYRAYGKDQQITVTLNEFITMIRQEIDAVLSLRIE